MFGGAICKCGLAFQFEIRAIWYGPWYFVFDDPIVVCLLYVLFCVVGMGCGDVGSETE
jgi:hypothetical protein